jgi:lysophospholipase L1-like esterase
MCMYTADQAPLTGWGMPFASFFDSTITIKNHAEGGESTRTFIEEKLWQPVSDSLKPGDYLLIQFGHNDEVPSKPSYTPPSSFKQNLVRFIKEARNKKAKPILITPVTRRQFDSAGNIQNVHVKYAGLVLEVAKQYKVPVIDLNQKSRELLQKLGPEQSKALFLGIDKNPYYPKGEEDITHFTQEGAQQIANIVLNGLKALHVEWAERKR